MISLRHSKKQGRHCIGEVLRQGQLSLGDVSDAPSLDAQWLLLHVLGKKEASWLQAHGDEELSDKEECEYRKLVERRGTGEPLAYILGYWEFYGRRFLVNKDVMIPRSSTENLIDAVLPRLQEGMVVADIGTGSGCIAITLALETITALKTTTPPSPPLSRGALTPATTNASPTSSAGGPDKGSLPAGQAGLGGVLGRVYATDISPAALIIARKNAQIHEVLDRVEFLEGSMLEPLIDKEIDLIVSNPPYLSAEALAKAGCATDTVGLMFEPRQALDGGEDGQDFIRQIETRGIPAVVEGTGGMVLTINLK